MFVLQSNYAVVLWLIRRVANMSNHTVFVCREGMVVVVTMKPSALTVAVSMLSKPVGGVTSKVGRAILKVGGVKMPGTVPVGRVVLMMGGAKLPPVCS